VRSSMFKWRKGPTRYAGSLAALHIGQRALVERIEGTGRAAQRLYEMGLVDGVEVMLVRRAPFGDPLELRVMGYALSLRAAEAAMIKVTVL
jgi:ferrous iron transport protein A